MSRRSEFSGGTGAQRIESTTFPSLNSVAFKNQDDGSKALLVFNSASSQQEFTVSDDGDRFSYTLPGKSLATFTWK